MSRFGGGFGRGRPRERNRDSDGFSRSCTTLFIASQDCGKIIGKGGSKIRELQDSTKAQIKVSRDNEGDGTRKVEISGGKAAIEEARRMIEDMVGLGTKGDGWRKWGDAPRNGSSTADGWRNGGDAVRNGSSTHNAQPSYDEEDWGAESGSDNKTYSQVSQAKVDSGWDGWDDTPTQGTWTNSQRTSGSQGREVRCHKCGEEGHFARDCSQSFGGGSRSGGGACHKCGEEGHFARDCSQSFGGGSRSGGRACHKCGEEGHFARDCPQSGGGAGSSRHGACYKCGQEGHMARDCSDQSTRDGFGSSQRRDGSNDWRQDTQEEGSLSDVVFVSEKDVGRIIGKGGSKIREIQEDSGCKLKISKEESEFGDVEVTLTGDFDAICKAKKLIYKCGITFCGGTIEEEEEEVEEVKPIKIDWKYLRENKERFERERFADCGPIVKEFYIEADHICDMHPEDARQFRKQNNNIMVDNVDCPDIPVPNPVQTFEDAFGGYPVIMGQIRKQGFKTPSPIQCQAWPILMSGLDLIGIAQTGTGKTLAFLLPALLHIDGQQVPRAERTGPTCLVLCPTRELALQIQEEVNKISYKGIKSVCVYGGGNRREQISMVKKGVEIVVATPGRLNDLIMNEIINVKSVSYLVLDEADRMLDMGFEPDIRKVLLDIRPDRQTVMTSATWPEDVQRLANQYMTKPMHVHVGTLDLAAVHSVKQEVMFMEDEEKKDYLFDFLTMMEPTDKVIVFVGKKIKADDISSDLALNGVMCQCIHGDREQCDRIQALDEFKHSVVRILVATDVASRGLDVKDITHVINYDFPRNIEDYVHRVGRTGRAGMTGTAVTFLTRGDWRSAQQLIDIMSEANQEIPEELIQMAERFQARKERDDREGRRGGRGSGRGGFGGNGRGGRFGRGGGRRDHDDFSDFMF